MGVDSKTVQRSASCRSRRELSNEYLLAKIGFDTEENEPCKVCPLSMYRSRRFEEMVVPALDAALDASLLPEPLRALACAERDAARRKKL